MTSPILFNRLISWLRVGANSRFLQWLCAIISSLHTTGIRDCFNSVNPETIHYVFKVLLVVRAAIVPMPVERHTALFIFSFHSVTQWGEQSLFLLLVALSDCVFSSFREKKSATTSSWEFHSKCSLSASSSVPVEKSGDKPGLSGRGGGGKAGSLQLQKKKENKEKKLTRL